MLRLITPPASEPVTLAEAKLHLRVDFADDDALIAMLISAARQDAETALNRALIAQTWDLVLDGWPVGQGTSRAGYLPRPLERPVASLYELRIPNPDLISVESITYIDVTGAPQTLDPSLYQVLSGTPGRITPALGQSWPAVAVVPGAVVVRYTAGYGADASSVPDCVKLWILLQAAGWYENREAITAGSAPSPLPALDRLLYPAKWGAYS